MRVSDRICRCVVFLGFPDDRLGVPGFEAVGTGFFVSDEGVGYLVTVRHVAKLLDDVPFRVRLNRSDGTARNLDADEVRWTFHPDENVDLAAILFHTGRKYDLDVVYLPSTMLATERVIESEYIGIGDICSTVGLFRLMKGELQNLPVVHTGNIAMMPGHDRIPVRDWDDPDGKKIRQVNGYLVEAQTLSGLSGSPVMVRPTIDVEDMLTRGGATVSIRAARHDLYLLGVWQAAWDAPPSEIMRAGRNNIQVPVGMGVVVPAGRIREILDAPELKAHRERARQEREALAQAIAASPQAAPIPAELEPPTTGEHPRHKEDFNRLLGAAVKGKK
jgi:hypothetical protein